MARGPANKPYRFSVGYDWTAQAMIKGVQDTAPRKKCEHPDCERYIPHGKQDRAKFCSQACANKRKYRRHLGGLVRPMKAEDLRLLSLLK